MEVKKDCLAIAPTEYLQCCNLKIADTQFKELLKPMSCSSKGCKKKHQANFLHATAKVNTIAIYNPNFWLVFTETSSFNPV